MGAGPAGLMLSHLLSLQGIESIVIELQSRAYCEQRVRAGLLEQTSVDLLVESGVGGRLQREALVHHGIELCFNRSRHRIDLFELTGRTVTIYGQQEVVKDLIAARLNAGGQLLFEAEAVGFDRLPGPKPVIRFQKDGELHEIHLRLHCRLRRISWCLPLIHPRGCAYNVRAGLSLWLAGNSRRGCSRLQRAGLRESRARLRSSHHALAGPQPALLAMRSR